MRSPTFKSNLEYLCAHPHVGCWCITSYLLQTMVMQTLCARFDSMVKSTFCCYWNKSRCLFISMVSFICLFSLKFYDIGKWQSRMKFIKRNKWAAKCLISSAHGPAYKRNWNKDIRNQNVHNSYEIELWTCDFPLVFCLCLLLFAVLAFSLIGAATCYL